MRLQAVARQMRCTEATLMPAALAMAGAVQWVASPGGARGQRDDPLESTAGSGGLRGGRVLSRSSPSTPACMKRSCQRQTVDLALPAARMIARRADPIGGQQHDPRPPDMLLRAVAIATIASKRERDRRPNST